MKTISYGLIVMAIGLFISWAGCSGDDNGTTDSEDVFSQEDADVTIDDDTTTTPDGNGKDTVDESDTNDDPPEDTQDDPDIAPDAEPPPPTCTEDANCVDQNESLGLCQHWSCVENECVAINLDDGTSCDDGNPCSEGGACQAGACVGGPTIPCEDDNPCTIDEHCEDGLCTGSPLPCDDENACTADSCDPAVGCVFVEESGVFGCPGHDEDGDGIDDPNDNCPYAYNVEQYDIDEDDAGDACAENACLTAQDIGLLHYEAEIDQHVYSCNPGCQSSDECTVTGCVAEATGLSEGCSGCYVAYILCEVSHCNNDLCANGDCSDCVQIEEICIPNFAQCSGLGLPPTGAAGCSEGFDQVCDGTCWPSGYWDNALDNNECDSLLNCSLFDHDGGDCSWECTESEIEDCFGGCVSAELLGNDVCNLNLNCTKLDNDGGDCDPLAPEECSGKQIHNCTNQCVDVAELANFIGTGTCESYYNCQELNYDGGDCAESSSCGPGYLVDCDGQCIEISTAAASVDNDACNDALACSAWLYDGGDCVICGDGVCQPGESTTCPDDCAGGDGGCANLTDQPILQGQQGGGGLMETISDCFADCTDEETILECASNCISEEVGLTLECSVCFAERTICTNENCESECANPQASSCENCMAENCSDAFGLCSGVPI